MHLFAEMAVSYFLVYVTFFALMKHERVRKYVMMSRFSTNISAVDFRLFLKNCNSYFRVTFSKTPLVAGIFLRGC